MKREDETSLELVLLFSIVRLYAYLLLWKNAGDDGAQTAYVDV